MEFSTQKQKTLRTAVDNMFGLVWCRSIIGRCRRRLCELTSRSFESHKNVSVAGADERAHHSMLWKTVHQ